MAKQVSCLINLICAKVNAPQLRLKFGFEPKANKPLDLIKTNQIANKITSTGLKLRDRLVLSRRTATMNTRSDASDSPRTIHVHIVDVVQQKEGGWTVIVQPNSEVEIDSEKVWRAALPGDFRGATRVERLWHLYYGSDPGYARGDWLDLPLPGQGEVD